VGNVFCATTCMDLDGTLTKVMPFHWLLVYRLETQDDTKINNLPWVLVKCFSGLATKSIRHHEHT
jgi:hypothetical protein